jgi:hypothetical protein
MIDAMNLLPFLVKSGTKTSMIDRTQVQLSVGILFAPSDGGNQGQRELAWEQTYTVWEMPLSG